MPPLQPTPRRRARTYRLWLRLLLLVVAAVALSDFYFADKDSNSATQQLRP